jgi:predicted Co/Zn/Cd cation transporter (cation efflux family)
MRLLRFLYFAVYSSSPSTNRVDLRFNPAAFILLIVQPVINSGLGLLLNLFTERHPLISGSDVIYARYDIWTYASIALSVFSAWFFFDRNRSAILAEFSGLHVKKWVMRSLLFGACLYIFMGFYLYTVNYFLSVLVFIGLLLAGRLWLKCFKIAGV